MDEQTRRLKDEAETLRAKGQFKAAIAAYQEATRITPDDVDSHHKLAELCIKVGELDRAVLALQRVAGRYAADGFLLKAIAINKRILSIRPDHTETEQAIADLYAKKNAPTATPGKGTLPARMTGAISKPKLAAVSVEEAKQQQAADAARQREASRALDLILDDDAPIEDMLERNASAAPGVNAAVDRKLDEKIDDEVDITWEPESVEEVVELHQVPSTPLFCDLTREDFISLLRTIDIRKVDAGTRMLTEGEPGDTMYILVQGTAAVFREVQGVRTEIARLEEGAFFGEMALIAQVPRLTCVEAASDVLVLCLTRAQMQVLAQARPIVGEVALELYKRRLLENLLAASPLFRAFGPDDKRAIIDGFASAHVPANTVVVHKGQPGAGLFLVLRGNCEVVDQDGDGDVFQIAPLREGDVFGEISLVRQQPAIATVRTTSNCHLLRLAPELFYARMMQHPQVQRDLQQMTEEKIKMTQDLRLAAGLM